MPGKNGGNPANGGGGGGCAPRNGEKFDGAADGAEVVTVVDTTSDEGGGGPATDSGSGTATATDVGSTVLAATTSCFTTASLTGGSGSCSLTAVATATGFVGILISGLISGAGVSITGAIKFTHNKSVLCYSSAR